MIATPCGGCGFVKVLRGYPGPDSNWNLTLRQRAALSSLSYRGTLSIYSKEYDGGRQQTAQGKMKQKLVVQNPVNHPCNQCHPEWRRDNQPFWPVNHLIDLQADQDPGYSRGDQVHDQQAG